MGPTRLRNAAAIVLRGCEKLNMLYLGAEAGTSILLEFAGRCLLVLLAISIFTMPLTQHLWTWDGFLHGGQDFEFRALGILLFLALAVVLSRSSRQCIELLFSRLWLPGAKLPLCSAAGGDFAAWMQALCMGSVPDAALRLTPLRI